MNSLIKWESNNVYWVKRDRIERKKKKPDERAHVKKTKFKHLIDFLVEIVPVKYEQNIDWNSS